MPRTFVHRARQAERKLVTGSLLAILAIIGIVSFLLVKEYDNAREVALRGAKNLAQLIEADVKRNVELYDLSLQGIVDASQDATFVQVPPSLQRQVLFGRAISMPLRGDLLWINERGQALASSVGYDLPGIDFSARDNFKLHQASTDPGLHISRPFKDQLGQLDWCIAFTRRISGPDGGFRGMASGVLRLDYFGELFKSLNIGKDSSVSLANVYGDILAREPEPAGGDIVGKNLMDRPNMQRMVRDPSGNVFMAMSSLDGTKRLYSYGQVAGLPLVVIVALGYDDVFGAWERTALAICFATLCLCLGIAWLTILFRRELRRGRRSEASLAALAATDPLTGLANRRTLDQTLQKEWARALRSGRDLAILMIDVDHFGAFNEKHGHQGGDQALGSVACIIAQGASRPGDLAARYGGEEFVVVLVETSLESAHVLAESIRMRVEALGVGGETSPLTVSIGVAAIAASDTATRTLETLMCAADTALYTAKREGRNRVCQGSLGQAKKTPAVPA
ncbi:sensor domain-containing diguanylate cyclase [Pseudomonas sp. DC3000-4b1]|uniref:sensor domain-containing diguanylate cyclase n=1 Tax=unclassified Pseudomonas TaxID=196821 RepID=UPI003CF14C24